jgi:hypothetical protein
MAITLNAVARNAAADAVVGLLDGGNILFQTAGDAQVAELTFGTPAFGAASNGVATANAITPDTSTIAGTITKFQVRTSANAVVFSGTVTAVGGGGDITLTSTTFANGETLSLSSFTYTQPSS